MISYERSIAIIGLSRTVSEINDDLHRKSQIPRVFCAPTEGVSLRIGYRRSESKYLNHGATGPRKKFDNIFSHMDTIHQHDRQTDRRTTDGRTPGDSKDRAYA